MRTSLPVLLLALGVVALEAAVSGSAWSEPAPDIESSQSGSSATEAAPAKPDRSWYDCVIEPNRIVELGGPVTGMLDKVLVERGQRVTRGQPIAELESSLQVAEINLARARAGDTSTIDLKKSRLAFEKRRIARNSRLMRIGILTAKEADEIKTAREIAEGELREAEHGHRRAQLELEQARARLALRTIRSPIDGLVIERNLDPGETVGETHIVKIADLDPLRVEVFVPVVLIGRIQAGASATIRFRTSDDFELAGHVKVVDRVADVSSGMFKVQIKLPNPDYRFPAGLNCKASFSLHGRQAFTAPATSRLQFSER